MSNVSGEKRVSAKLQGTQEGMCSALGGLCIQTFQGMLCLCSVNFRWELKSMNWT